MFQDANDESLTACVRQDTHQVRYISTAYSPTVVGAALRRVNARYERINQPLLCSEYCCHYQNVDRFDQAKSQYLISRRSHHSWKYLWFFFIPSNDNKCIHIVQKNTPCSSKNVYPNTFQIKTCQRSDWQFLCPQEKEHFSSTTVPWPRCSSYCPDGIA